MTRDLSFARALLDEAASLFLNGDPETARLTLRDLVNATVGFERLAEATGKPVKSLHRGPECGACARPATGEHAAARDRIPRERPTASGRC
jgi:hypothetical protein